MNQTKKLSLIVLFVFCLQSSFAQKLFQSTQEVGVQKINPSMQLKQKVAKIIGDMSGNEKDDYLGFVDEDFYQLKNGYISYRSDSWLIFDKNENWLQTREKSHCDVQQEDEYYQILSKMNATIKKKYFIEECNDIYKIINKKGYWYEINALALPKKLKKVILIFDKNIKLIGERKGK